MTQGRSIRLFLVDGSPNGLLTAEIMNWIGHVLMGPRSRLSELVQRPEVGRTGVYFLVGPDPENGLRPQVYIGESDDVGKRLKQHNRPEDQGGKDFWEKVCLVTSKDQNLTKAHVKYLESLFTERARELGRCKLMNGTANEYGNLPEADLADMAFFAEQVRTVLPVLGLEFLRDHRRPVAEPQPAATPEPDSPAFELKVPKYGIHARAREIDGEFVVLEGSTARARWVSDHQAYMPLHEQLCDEGILGPAEDELRTFTADYAFSSPSAAAAVVCGHNANGRKKWETEGNRESYGDWQDRQVSGMESGNGSE